MSFRGFSSRLRIWSLAGLIAALNPSMACRHIASVAEAPGTRRGLDIQELLDRASGGRVQPRAVQRIEVTRGGRRLQAVALIAPANVEIPLPGLEGRGTLELTAAPVFNIGDGFGLEIYIKGPGTGRRIHVQYFDPGRRAADRKWQSLSVPLDLNRGDTLLEFRVDGGPQGDLVDDWLAIAGAKLFAGEQAR